MRDLCRAEDDKTEMVLQGERCLEQTLPKIIPEDRQSGKHQKRKQICIDGYMAWKIHDLFKRTLKKAKYTPLLDPLMESVTRKVLILIIGQIIHGIKHAHACKEESLEGLQL